MSWSNRVEIEELVGHGIAKIDERDDHELITFETIDVDAARWVFSMFHEQDCCEHVFCEDIDGDLQKLVGNVILEAQEVVSSDTPDGHAVGEREEDEWYDESNTWTFYKLTDSAGNRFVIRWWGSSNGYYSEGVTVTRAPRE